MVEGTRWDPDLRFHGTESVVLTDLAGKLEKTNPSEAGKLWRETSKHLDELVKKSPDGAFALAVEMILWPKEDNADREWFARWLRGTGLSVLTDDRLKGQLTKFFRFDEKSLYVEAQLVDLISMDLEFVRTEEDLSKTPEC